MSANGRNKNTVSRSLDTSLLSSSRSLGQFPEAKSPYNQVTHGLRKIVPGELACKIGCKGAKCKYDNSDWPREKMAISGLFSNWITDDILAMARPTTELINNHDLIHNMRIEEIRSIFNLQSRGEHKDCGLGLHKESGFSYNPIDFTSNGIYYYNYELEDFSIASMRNLIDMVKVFCFALKQGKVAVHCHAGLGRTGFFIACYLIYANKAQNANEAIYMIREKRPGSVQMQQQINAVKEFEAYLRPLRVVYSQNYFSNNYTNSDGAISHDNYFSLGTFLHRQKLILHGSEGKKLKYIPKVIYACGEQLRRLIINWNADEVDKKFRIKKNNSMNEMMNDIIDPCNILQSSRSSRKNSQNEDELSANIVITKALIENKFSKKIIDKLEYYQQEINENNYDDELANESDPCILGLLIWSWLDHLKEPVLKDQEINILFKNIPTNYLNSSKHAEEITNSTLNWHELANGTFFTINYLTVVLHDLLPLSPELEDCLISKLVRSLTQTQLDAYANDPVFLQTSSHRLNSTKISLLQKIFKNLIHKPIHVSTRRLGKFNFNKKDDYDYAEEAADLREHQSRSRKRNSNI